MRPMIFVRVLFAVSLTCSLFGACRDTVGSNLMQQLQSYYAPTSMDGLKVAKPGCTVTVQKDGLLANPSSKLLGAYGNTYQDGQVIAGKTGIKSFLPGRDKLQTSSVRGLGVGEKAYLTKFDVQDNGVTLTIQTCGRCEVTAVDPAHKPYRASVDVKFQKGYLNLTDWKHVVDAVSEVLAIADDSPGQNTGAPTDTQMAAQPQQTMQPAAQQQAPPPPPEPAQSFAPIAPPPPPADVPPPKPVQIEKGQTVDQVTSALGQPQTILKAEGKQIYLFKDFKITFVNGKVSEIDIR